MPVTSRSRLPLLTIRGIRTSAVEVPVKFPLGTSAGAVHSAPLQLIDLETEEGINGRTYLFCYRPSVPRGDPRCAAGMQSRFKEEAVAPLDSGVKLARRFARVGVASVVRMGPLRTVHGLATNC
jgi:mandelate racemase